MLAGDLPGADEWYDRALAVDPRYARAMFGKAEVAFQRSRATTCDGATDVGALSGVAGRVRRCVRRLPVRAAERPAANPVSCDTGAPPDRPGAVVPRPRRTSIRGPCCGQLEPSGHRLPRGTAGATGHSWLTLRPRRMRARLRRDDQGSRIGSGGGDVKLDRALALGPDPARSVVIRSFRALIDERLGRTAHGPRLYRGHRCKRQPCPLLSVTNFLLPYTAPLRLAMTGSTSATSSCWEAC